MVDSTHETLMKNITYLYLLNTAILMFPLVKQFKILVHSPDRDPLFIGKLLFFVFNLTILVAMWLCYLRIREAAWFFFMIVVIIAAWAYYKPKKQNNATRRNTNTRRH